MTPSSEPASRIARTASLDLEYADDDPGSGPAGATGPAGPTGATGATGAAGVGVPTGGTTGQVGVDRKALDRDERRPSGRVALPKLDTRTPPNLHGVETQAS
jgi:hypothetical protein